MRGLVFAGWSVILAGACDRPPFDPSSDECRVDDDCTLMPSVMNCCGECAPAPPFEAVPRTAVDARLLELDTLCGQRTTVCEPMDCDVAQPGCQASASCVAGHCMVVQNDKCGLFLVGARRNERCIARDPCRSPLSPTS